MPNLIAAARQIKRLKTGGYDQTAHGKFMYDRLGLQDNSPLRADRDTGPAMGAVLRVNNITARKGPGRRQVDSRVLPIYLDRTDGLALTAEITGFGDETGFLGHRYLIIPQMPMYSRNFTVDQDGRSGGAGWPRP